MTANSTGMTGKTANNEVEAIKAGKLILFICTLKAFESPLYIGIVKSRVKNVFLLICVFIFMFQSSSDLKQVRWETE